MGGIMDVFGDLFGDIKINEVTKERLALVKDKYEALEDKYEALEKEKAKVEQKLREVSTERDRLEQSGGSKMRAGKYHRARIYRNVKENPRRVNSNGHRSFDVIYDGMTRAEYKADGGLPRDLWSDDAKGNVRLVFPGDPGNAYSPYEALEREKAGIKQKLREVSAERNRLKEENTRLKEENARLRSEIKRNEKVSPEMKEILVIFFKAGEESLSSAYIASAMSIKNKKKAQRYFDKLVELKLISWAGDKLAGGSLVDLYALTPEGRAYVMEQGLRDDASGTKAGLAGSDG